jgi:hypothetical protein
MYGVFAGFLNFNVTLWLADPHCAVSLLLCGIGRVTLWKNPGRTAASKKQHK